jgi:hypothetical protein
MGDKLRISADRLKFLRTTRQAGSLSAERNEVVSEIDVGEPLTLAVQYEVFRPMKPYESGPRTELDKNGPEFLTTHDFGNARNWLQGVKPSSATLPKPPPFSSMKIGFVLLKWPTAPHRLSI